MRIFIPLVVVALATPGALIAQTATPAAKTAVVKPTATSAAPVSKAPQTALSKSCSDQADAKGLHGKDRKKFRETCKHSKN